MNALPEEVCLLIFSCLNRRDRLNARLVCKEWLRLCSDRSLTNNDVLHLDYYKITESDFSDGETKATLSVQNVIMTVQDCARGRQDSYYFRKYGAGVKSLHLMFESCCYSVFPDVFKYCTALEELKLENGDTKNCKCFGYYRFYVSGQPAWKAEEVFSFLTQSEGLKCLKSLDVVKDRFGKFIPFLPKLVEVHGKFMKEFSYVTLAEYKLRDLTSLLEFLNPNLTKLWIKSHYGPSYVKLIAEKFLNLRKLCLSSCSYTFTEPAESHIMVQFFVKLKSLTHLYLHGITISNADAKSLASMPNLVSLQLKKCAIEDSDIEIVKQKAKVTIEASPFVFW